MSMFIRSAAIFALIMLSFSAPYAYAQTKSPLNAAPLNVGNVQPEKADSALSDVLHAPHDKAVDRVESVTIHASFWQNLSDGYMERDASGIVSVDYGHLKASKTSMDGLDEYIQRLSQQSPSQMGRDEAMAYWANLYNALTVQVVAENYPVDSIREIKSGRRKGPWKRKLVVVEGRTLTLDTIEHDIMRPTYKTPLVHYMLNCASIGCPNLSQNGWKAETLEADLNEAARAYINSARGVSFEGKRMKISRIYKWFSKDFGGSKADVIAHLSKYADVDLRKKIEARGKIDKYAYDWSLNTTHMNMQKENRQ